MLMILKIAQRRTNIAPPSEHEIARLKNSGITPLRRLVTKNVKAAEGKQKAAIRSIGLRIPSLIFVLRLIIIKFKSDVTLTHAPIPTISARIPITPGKRQIPRKRKIEPMR